MPIIEELPSDCEDGSESEQVDPSISKIKKPETPEEAAERLKRWQEQEEDEARRVQIQFDKGEACRVEGNALMANGSFAEACAKYEEGLQDLVLVGNKPEDRAKAEKANLAFHLNISLAKLKLEEFEQVKTSATSALTIEPQNVKALYRRAVAEASLARKASLFQEAEAKSACADLEEILRMDPSNSDATRELLQMQKEIRKHEQDLLEGQKRTWGKVFGGRAPSNGEEDAIADNPPAMVRPAIDGSRHMVVSLEGVSCGQTLAAVDLELREKWCIGLFAKDDVAKTMLVNILKRRRTPTRGTLRYPRKAKSGVREDEQIVVNDTLFGAILAVSVAIFMALAKCDLALPVIVIFMIFVSCAIGLSFILWLEYRQKSAPPKVLHIQADCSKCSRPSGRSAVIDLLIHAFPKIVSKGDRPSRAKAMLRAAGMTCQDMDLLRDLSDQDKQLVYILKAIASRPPVLICDDALSGLDSAPKARVLRMLRRAKQDCSTSIILISTDLQELSLASDSLGILSKGQLCELGPSEELLECPRHEETKEAVSTFRRNSSPEAGRLNQNYLDLLNDEALAAMWLPKA